MAHLRPDVFGQDLFFAYGSQDDYSVFGRVYGTAVGLGGLTGASRALWGAAQSLWFLVAVAWVGRAVAREHLLLVAACVFALPGFYGSDTVFRSAESFLTARSFAEPIALGAILLVALGRRWLGVAALAGALLVHPIMALPAALVVGLLVFQRILGTWRRIFLAAALAVAVGLATLHFGGWIRRVDDQWYSILVALNPYLLPDRWQSADWGRQLFPMLLLAMVARHADPRWARVWSAFAACAALGLVLMVIAWGLRWELGMQAQFWRFGWLACWAAPLAALQLAASGGVGKSQQIVLCATIPALALTSQGWWPLAWQLPLICMLFMAASLYGSDRRGRGDSLAAFVMAGLLGIVALGGGMMAVLAAGFATGSAGHEYALSLGAVAATNLGWIALPCVVLIGSRISSGWKPGAGGTLVAAVFAGIALVGLDARGTREVMLDRMIDEGLPEWTAAIPSASSVLWPEHMARVWLGLGRQSYVSREQLVGIVFSRRVAVEGVRRMNNVRFVAGRDGIIGFRGAAGAEPARASTLDDLRMACADPMLDFVVSTLAPAHPIVTPYVDPITAEASYLHRCVDLRGS